MTRKLTGQVDRNTGTGFLISSSGYVLTNKHVIEAGDPIDDLEIYGSIASKEATPSRLVVIGTNQHDVALLKFADTSKAYSAFVLGQPRNVKVGTPVCSEGFPADKDFFFAEGPVSEIGAEHGLWLTQMPSNPGDSGGPVFLSSGKVVAIKVGGYTALQNVNALIPMNLAQDLLILVPDRTPEATPSGTKPVDLASRKFSCNLLQNFQGSDNNKVIQLVVLSEKAFAQHDYECVISYLNRAKALRSSFLWMRYYPYLAGAYLLARHDRQAFDSTLQQMLAEMRLDNSFLHSNSQIDMVLSCLTDVRQDLDPRAQSYLDNTVFPEVRQIKSTVRR
jgi:hypothetical protein